MIHSPRSTQILTQPRPRPAARLARQGRAGLVRPRGPRPAALHPGEGFTPRSLIDDLRRYFPRPRRTKRRQASTPRPGCRPDLFADFNGIHPRGRRQDRLLPARPELVQPHDPGRLSLQVMASLAEREGLRGKVQCIYFDPPYGITLHPDGHRPRRPRARPHLRLRHHRLCRRAMGPPLDHHRHLARGPGLARARIMGARYPYYLLADSPKASCKEAEVTRTCPPPSPPRQHPPGLRLRAGAAHHAQIHRQQRRDRRDLGQWQQSWSRCASSSTQALGNRRGRSGRSVGRARREEVGAPASKTCTPNGGKAAHRPAARDRRLHRRQGRVRVPLRQALRRQEEGARGRPVHGGEPVAPPRAGVDEDDELIDRRVRSRRPSTTAAATSRR
jgi:hypothetical protein